MARSAESLDIARVRELCASVQESLTFLSQQGRRLDFDPLDWFTAAEMRFGELGDLPELSELLTRLSSINEIELPSTVAGRLSQLSLRIVELIDKASLESLAGHDDVARRVAIQPIESALGQVDAVITSVDRCVADQFHFVGPTEMAQGILVVYDPHAFSESGAERDLNIEGAFLSEIVDIGERYNGREVQFVQIAAEDPVLGNRWFELEYIEQNEPPRIEEIEEKKAVETLLAKRLYVPAELAEKYGGYKYVPKSIFLETVGVSSVPSYESDGRVLSLFGRELTKFDSKEDNLTPFLEAFESAGWPQSTVLTYEHHSELKAVADGIRSNAKTDRFDGLLQFKPSQQKASNTVRVTWKLTEKGEAALQVEREAVRANLTLKQSRGSSSADDYYADTTTRDFPDDEVPF